MGRAAPSARMSTSFSAAAGSSSVSTAPSAPTAPLSTVASRHAASAAASCALPGGCAGTSTATRPSSASPRRPAHLAGDAQRHVAAQLLARRRVVHARAFEQAAEVTRPGIVLGGPRQPAPGARARPRLHHVLEQLPAPRPDVGDAVGIPVCFSYSRALHHRDDEDAALFQPASERRRRGEVLRDFFRVAVHDGDARGLPQRRQGEHALVAELVPLNHAHVAERQLAL